MKDEARMDAARIIDQMDVRAEFHTRPWNGF